MNDQNRAARAPRQGAAKPDPAKGPGLGPMPVWNLADLYSDPKSETVEADLKKAAAEAQRIKQHYQGKLVALATDGAALAQVITAYENLSDIIGKLGSYAGLLYAADTSNPETAKFYGDIQEKITAITTDLIFFEPIIEIRSKSVQTGSGRWARGPWLRSWLLE
jgi:oligoendopeptidase F